MKKIFLIVLFNLFFFSIVSGEEKVTLQLKWKHQFQFAGYYAALEKGFYLNEGLDVTIVEAQSGKKTSDEVLNGNAHFGIAMSDLIALRAAGKPVVALAVIYQHSPLILLSPQVNQISNIHALKGKKVSLESHAEELIAYFEAEGVPSNKMILYPHQYDVSSLISGQVDAMSAYSTDEPFVLKQKDIPYTVFSPRAGGIDFYGDTLFTTQQLVKQKPKTVSAFLRASLKGWQYALNNKNEIIDLILTNYSRRHSREHLEFEANVSEKLIMADVVELGYINPGRWEYIASVFKSLNKIPGNFKIDGFIYDKNPAPNQTAFYIGFVIIMAICFFIFLIAVYFFQINRKLKNEISQRKKLQDSLKNNEKMVSTLMSNLPGIAYRCLMDEHYTMQFLSQGCKDLTGYDVNYLINNKYTSYNEIIYPEDREYVSKTVSDAIANYSPFKLIYRIITKEEEIKWVFEQGRGFFTSGNELTHLEGFITDITQQKKIEIEKENLVEELQTAISEIKTLSGLLPICSHCKKIRDDKGYWNQIEEYLDLHTDAKFSHGICKDCAIKYYPSLDLYEE